MKICEMCGHEGDDVGRYQHYIGGQGYIWMTECQDAVECWECFDALQEVLADVF